MAFLHRSTMSLMVEVITVKARRGRLVHGTALGSERLNQALCGKPTSGFLVVDSAITCPRCLELQRAKPTRTVNQDPSGHWRTKLGKLADKLGYNRFEIWRHWSQIALQVEFEVRLSRALSEAKAYDLTVGCFDKVVGQAEAS